LCGYVFCTACVVTVVPVICWICVYVEFCFCFSFGIASRPSTSFRIRNCWKSAMKKIPEIKLPLNTASNSMKIPTPSPPRRRRPSTAHELASSAPHRSPHHSCSPARKIVSKLSPATSCDRLTPPDQMRQRSSSFGNASQYYRKKLAAQINLDLPIKKTISNSSVNSSTESLCDHHDVLLGHQKSIKHSGPNTCSRCMRKEKLKEVTWSNDLIFDHIHGEIRHRPKQAFGRTVHDGEKISSVKKLPPKSKSPSPDRKRDSAIEPVTADEFINKCIIESETTIIRAAQKPTGSSLFSQLLGEFLPHDDETLHVELKAPETPRERAYSMPSEWRRNRNTIACGMRLQIEQTGN